MGIGEVWNLIAVQPVLNVLIVLGHNLLGNFGLAIIVLTIIIRGLMYPLTVKQLKATKAMQSLQPKLSQLKQKYAKDKTRMAQEQTRLYKESGISPAGCAVPMLIQMPIWIALYWAIIKVLSATPEGFLKLSQQLYSWPVVYSTVPLESTFLWLDMAIPDRWLILPILVGGTMWVQQKMVMSPTTDPTQQAQSKMMLWMMPIMFAFLTMQFPSGLALYWVASNVISIVMQYFVTGWGGLVKSAATKQVAKGKVPKRMALPEAPSDDDGVIEEGSEQEEETDYGEPRDKSRDSGRGYSVRPKPVRQKPRRSRSHRPKRK